MDWETKNAIISKVLLDDADRGFLSGWLMLDYGGSAQGFGGYALYLPKSFSHHGGPNFAGHFIWRCMEIAGVSKWDAIAGKTIRVRLRDDKIIAIGHIVKDDWFHPQSDFEAMKDRAATVAATLFSAMVDVEWGGTWDDGEGGKHACCPFCSGLKSSGEHTEDCRVMLALTKARG